MNAVEFLPAFVVHAVLVGSVIGIFISSILELLPFPNISHLQKTLRTVCLALLVCAIYLEGALSNQQKWEHKLLEAQVAAAQAQVESERLNSKLTQELEDQRRDTYNVTQTNLDKIKELAEMMDRQCKIDEAVIDVLNSSASNSIGEKK